MNRFKLINSEPVQIKGIVNRYKISEINWKPIASDTHQNNKNPLQNSNFNPPNSNGKFHGMRKKQNYSWILLNITTVKNKYKTLIKTQSRNKKKNLLTKALNPPNHLNCSRKKNSILSFWLHQTEILKQKSVENKSTKYLT